jgi:hypothetical protein
MKCSDRIADLEAVQRQPTIRTKCLATRPGTSQAPAYLTLQEQLSHTQTARELAPDDAPARRAFSQ